MCYIINTSWKFLWLGNLTQDFLGVKFWSGNFFWILFEALGILGVLIFAPFNYPCHFKSRVLPTPPPPSVMVHNTPPPPSVMVHNIMRNIRKKIKELLLNFLRSEDDYVEVSRLKS